MKLHNFIYLYIYYDIFQYVHYKSSTEILMWTLNYIYCFKFVLYVSI